MRIAVYCSSSAAIDQKYLDLASDLGRAIGARKWNLVTGGGQISMMGAVSDAAREAGAHTIGVIPQALVDIEFIDRESQEIHVVDTMRQRKAMIEEFADAFITLPGGLGTMEELFEMWVSSYLGMHTKTLIVLDPFDYYAPLRLLVDKFEAEGFVKPGQRQIVQWCTSIDEALNKCENLA
jgi:uncharacterized protein (TIGR00730 family)